MTRGKSLSVVRMGDGEKILINQCKAAPLDEFVQPPAIKGPVEGEAWLRKLGVWGITNGQLMLRMGRAVEQATYYAPSITGLQKPLFDLYAWSSLYRNDTVFVDNFFVNAWTEEEKINLFKLAGHVLLIHRNAEPADAMQIRAQKKLGVKVSYIKIDNWQDTERVIKDASKLSARLVLFSAGPAGKYIGPAIAKAGLTPAVIDIGNSVDQWTLSSLQ